MQLFLRQSIPFLVLYMWVLVPAWAGKIVVVPDQFSSIQKALDAAEEYDTVFVKKGLYKESITMHDCISLIGESSDSTILKGNGSSPVIKSANNAVCKNLTATLGGIGILSENTNVTIINCVISYNQKTGIQCLISLPHIQNNLIMHNGWSGIFCELVTFGTQNAIENNIIAFNGNSGIMLSRKSGVLVQNNIFFKNKQYGIYVSPDSRKSRIIFNDFFRDRVLYNQDAIIDATNITIDPQFPNEPWQHSFFGSYSSPLKTLGKDNKNIGISRSIILGATFRDSDDDSIDDSQDQCPDLPEDFDGYQDEDGCPDLDNDSDGIPDKKDLCPNEPEDFDGYMDLDGCPDPDNDKDGIPDAIDKCPNQPETVNGFQDDDGCPDETPTKK